MTVKEVIEALQKQPESHKVMYPVSTEGEDGFPYESLIEVEEIRKYKPFSADDKKRKMVVLG